MLPKPTPTTSILRRVGVEAPGGAAIKYVDYEIIGYTLTSSYDKQVDTPIN